MRINISTEYDKKLKYGVYNVEGKKRKLISKGKFIKNACFDVTPSGKEITVRITPNRGFKILAVPFIGFKNICKKSRNVMPTFTVLKFFDEIKIKDLQRAGTAELKYTISPFFDKTYQSYSESRVYVDYLTCSTHPFKEERDKILKANRHSETICSFIFTALVVGIVAVLVSLFA